MSDLRCCKRIWRGFHSHQCTRTGTLEYGGKWWCKQHHPPTKDARYEERENQRLEQFHAKQQAEREALIADGWRRCAVGQRTTQHCGLAEEARAQERARIRALVQGLLTETIARYYMDEIPESQYDEGVTVGLSKVLALIDKEGTSHE